MRIWYNAFSSCERRNQFWLQSKSIQTIFDRPQVESYSSSVMAVACILWLPEPSSATYLFSWGSTTSFSPAYHSRQTRTVPKRHWHQEGSHAWASSRWSSEIIVCHANQLLHASKLRGQWTLNLEELWSLPEPEGLSMCCLTRSNKVKTCENRDEPTSEPSLRGWPLQRS